MSHKPCNKCGSPNVAWAQSQRTGKFYLTDSPQPGVVTDRTAFHSKTCGQAPAVRDESNDAEVQLANDEIAATIGTAGQILISNGETAAWTDPVRASLMRSFNAPAAASDWSPTADNTAVRAANTIMTPPLVQAWQCILNPDHRTTGEPPKGKPMVCQHCNRIMRRL